MIKIKTVMIILGDIIALYSSLTLMLIARYGLDYFKDPFIAHIKPFSFIFIAWLLIFYIFDLYKNKLFKINFEVIQGLILGIFTSIIVSIVFFYLFPSLFKLTPKTNLLIFALIFAFFVILIRFFFAKFYISSGWRNRLLVIGESYSTKEIINYIKTNPQSGYDPVMIFKKFPEEDKIEKIILENKIDTVILGSNFKKNPTVAKKIYRLLAFKIPIIDATVFFETIFQKVPLNDIEEGLLVEKISPRQIIYEKLKRIFDIIFSFFLIIALSPLMAIIAIIIKTTSQGPILYKQERTGLNNKVFVLYKFRSMVTNHSGPLWTKKNDNRITVAGKIIRYTHTDEMPQLFNILMGEISFIGPRAESKDLVEIYQQLPYYNLRHIIKPGLTGWAQVNYKPSTSVKEAGEKLQYDIYYIKNQSPALDFLILLKTIKYLFFSFK